MQKSLNIELIKKKMDELGLSQASLSKDLAVSREAVSQWFRRASFPRPDKLLRFGQILALRYNQLVINDLKNDPIVSFRKVGGSKTTEKHLKRGKEMGFALERLVKYLPFETITNSPTFNCPQNSYTYIQAAAKAIRKNFKIDRITIEVSEIIKQYSKNKTILIPILLGEKHHHENALHIFLPESTSNWVYINLDTNELDFKFWLTHELGHILAPQLKQDDAEVFADNFAGAFLFPEEIANEAYEKIICDSNDRKIIDIVLQYANRYVISAITVFKEINKYAASVGKKEFTIGNAFYQRNTVFEKDYKLVSEKYFGKNRPKADEFIKAVEKEFETNFYELLRNCKKHEEITPSYIKSVLNLSTIDSIEIYNNL